MEQTPKIQHQILRYMTTPKVTVIIPTANRPELLQRAIAIYNSQDYHNKELIIYESDAKSVSMVTEGDIRHYGTISKPTVGDARNKAIMQAKGDIIISQDDDDIYAPDWITRSVEMLIESEADIVGLKDAYFYKPDSNELWFYENRDNERQYALLGATMCYWRKTWENARHSIGYDRVGHGFMNVNRGEDAYFCEYAGKVAYHDYIAGFLATRHSKNSNSDIRHPFFKKVPNCLNTPDTEIRKLYERHTQRQSTI